MHDSGSRDPPTFSSLSGSSVVDVMVKEPAWKFITFQKPGEPQDPRRRKAIRTQAALSSQPTRSYIKGYNRRRARKAEVSIGFDVIDTSLYRSQTTSGVTHDALDIGDGTFHPTGPSAEVMLQLSDKVFGGGSVDPFRTYPIPFEPWLPRVIHHCKLETTCPYNVTNWV
jgi:hypothetical protein